MPNKMMPLESVTRRESKVPNSGTNIPKAETFYGSSESWCGGSSRPKPWWDEVCEKNMQGKTKPRSHSFIMR